MLDEFCGVGIAAELPVAGAELDMPLGAADPEAGADADADVCVIGDMPDVPDVVSGFVVPLWPPDRTSVDVIAAEPVGVVLSRPDVERLLNAMEPMTAIPAKPPVAVTLRTSERRRWEARLR